jgi:uncharacterized protein (TIGR02145 family)
MKIINYNKYLVLCIVLLCFIVSCKKTDQNGFEISTIKLGDQTWMSNNLNVDKFNNGDIIKEIKTEDEWKDAIKSKSPAWCYYDNNIENGKKHGKIYNWYAISDPRGLAPLGWRMPLKNDWVKLFDELGGIEKAFYYLRLIDNSFKASPFIGHRRIFYDTSQALDGAIDTINTHSYFSRFFKSWPGL